MFLPPARDEDKREAGRVWDPVGGGLAERGTRRTSRSATPRVSEPVSSDSDVGHGADRGKCGGIIIRHCLAAVRSSRSVLHTIYFFVACWLPGNGNITIYFLCIIETNREMWLPRYTTSSSSSQGVSHCLQHAESRPNCTCRCNTTTLLCTCLQEVLYRSIRTSGSRVPPSKKINVLMLPKGSVAWAALLSWELS